MPRKKIVREVSLTDSVDIILKNIVDEIGVRTDLTSLTTKELLSLFSTLARLKTSLTKNKLTDEEDEGKDEDLDSVILKLREKVTKKVEHDTGS